MTESLTGLGFIFNEWMRPYQRDILMDKSRYRAVLKSRRVGISDLVALEMVLTSSGLGEAIGLYPHNCNVISKTQSDAKDVIKYCKNWSHTLAKDPQLAPFVERGDEWSKESISFARSGWFIRAHTQTEDAARGSTGHLYRDEMAFYRYSSEIQKGAVPSIDSDPRLRLTEVSTPNGTSGAGELFYEICTDAQSWPQYSRHRITIEDAVAQGMPVDIEEVRARCFTEDDFRQEYMCEFIGAGAHYFDRNLLQHAHAPRPHTDHTVYMGIDVASEVDTTGVFVIRRIGGVTWLCERYLLDGVPYASNGNQIGQDVIIGALVRYYEPVRTCIDITGDTSIIMSRLAQQQLPTRWIPQQFSDDWKKKVVPGMKGELERGTVLFDDSCSTLRYRKAVAEREASDINTIKANPHDFVEMCFAPDPQDPIFRDFERVHKKLLKHGVTFDTTRDNRGHGDLFWAAVMGWNVAGNTASKIDKPRVHHTRKFDTAW